MTSMGHQTLEQRLTELEKKVEQIVVGQDKENRENSPWWAQWFAAFKDNPAFEAAMKRGEEYRRSQPTAADEPDSALPT